MKFVSFKSRGGDYLVIVQNVAWLRSHENGQTKVGIIGSEAILVAGSIEEQPRRSWQGSALQWVEADLSAQRCAYFRASAAAMNRCACSASLQ